MEPRTPPARLFLPFYPFTFLPLKRQVALIYAIYRSCGADVLRILGRRKPTLLALLIGIPAVFLFLRKLHDIAIIITVW